MTYKTKKNLAGFIIGSLILSTPFTAKHLVKLENTIDKTDEIDAKKNIYDNFTNSMIEQNITNPYLALGYIKTVINNGDLCVNQMRDCSNDDLYNMLGEEDYDYILGNSTNKNKTIATSKILNIFFDKANLNCYSYSIKCNINSDLGSVYTKYLCIIIDNDYNLTIGYDLEENCICEIDFLNVNSYLDYKILYTGSLVPSTITDPSYDIDLYFKLLFNNKNIKANNYLLLKGLETNIQKGVNNYYDNDNIKKLSLKK